MFARVGRAGVGFLSRTRERSAASAAFLVNFALAKVAIYAVPLIIAANASAAVYGGVELAWSIGLLVAACTTSVPLAGLNQRYLIRRERGIGDEISIVLALASFLSLLVSVTAPIFALPASFRLVAAAFACTALHSTAALGFRMLGRPNLSAWSDGTAMLITLALIAICMWSGLGVTVESLTLGYTLLAGAVLAGASVYLLSHRSPHLWGRLKRSMAIGAPMTAGGVLALWLGVGGRISVGLIRSADVAAYSVAFRVAGLALGLHQLANTLLYARLYRARTREADFILSRFLAAVVVFSVAMALVGPSVITRLRFEAIQASGGETAARIVPIVSLQVFFWIGFAMLQLRINRAGIAGRFFPSLLLVTLVGAAATFALAPMGLGNISALCWALALHAAAYFFTACLALARARLPHRQTFLVGTFGGSLLGMAALLIPATR